MATLLLEDGRRFDGEGYGARATRVGEAVFNTAMHQKNCKSTCTQSTPQILQRRLERREDNDFLFSLYILLFFFVYDILT